MRKHRLGELTVVWPPCRKHMTRVVSTSPVNLRVQVINSGLPRVGRAQRATAGYTAKANCS